MVLPSITSLAVIPLGRCEAVTKTAECIFFWQVILEIYTAAWKCFIILCTSLAAAERH